MSKVLPLRALVLCLCILLLAFAVRVHLLGAQSLWNDEGNSYVQATRSLTEIAANAARDIHPPGYYWLLALWRILTGESEFALRSLSTFASLITVAFTYAIGKRLFSPLAGLAAALFVALNTFSIYYAQEARMYALLALWSAAGMWALIGFLQTRGTKYASSRNWLTWALALALFNTAGLWTQYAYPFVMLAQGIIFLAWFVSTRPALSALLRYIAANLLTIALYLPWLPAAWAQITTWPNTGEPTPLNTALGLIAGWFTLGVTFSASDASWVALGLLLIAFGLRVRQPAPSWPRLLIPLAWAIVPVAIFLILGLFREANLKFLLPAQIGIALLMGRGVWVLWTLKLTGSRPFVQFAPRLAASIGVAGLTVALWNGLYPLYHDPNFQRDDYRSIAQEISVNLQPNDAIILDAPNQAEVFRYYYRGDAPVYPLPAGLGGDDVATSSALREIIDTHRAVFVVFWGETERDPNRVVEGTLDTEAFEIRNDWYGDVRLARYLMPHAAFADSQTSGAQFGDHITLVRYALSADALTPGDILAVQLEWQTDAPLTTRYKVFVQLLDADGQLVTQRDSEPGGGLALTTTWQPDQTVIDRHALMIPNNLPSTHYTLIIGLYNENNPQERLPIGISDYLTLIELKAESVK